MRRDDKRIRINNYVIRRMHQRAVSKAQVIRTIRQPQASRPARREGGTRLERKFSARKRLAVIVDEFEDIIEVVTVFWM